MQTVACDIFQWFGHHRHAETQVDRSLAWASQLASDLNSDGEENIASGTVTSTYSPSPTFSSPSSSSSKSPLPSTPIPSSPYSTPPPKPGSNLKIAIKPKPAVSF